jgi:predicted CopG family antitoxin
VVKVISLSNEAYEKLAQLKHNHSFSETVLSLIEEKHEEKKPKKALLSLLGSWPGGNEELNRIERMVNEDRKKFRLREVTF